MAARKAKRQKVSSKARKARRRSGANRPAVSEVVRMGTAVVPEPVTDIITEKTHITTEPQVEIRRPATLAQALTEPVVAVVKPKTKVRKEIHRRRA